jgi:TolB-like protein
MRYGGERIVKNITSPIPVWHITVGDHDGRADAATSGSIAIPSPTRRPIIRIIAGVTLLLAVAALISAIWYYDSKPNSKTNRVPGLGVTDERPAVIVLPFVNLSDDSRQDYFVNGFVEDITTDLAKLGGLYVVSSNAAARYKGEKVDFGDLRERFGVSHAVEGSIRKAQDQVRISVRLVEVIGGKHVWGERYDIGVQGIFRVQDKVRGKILTALRVNLSRLEKQRFAKAPTINLEAYDYYLRGQEATRQARLLGEPDLMDDAIALFEQAVAIDPNYAAAYAAIGISRYIQWFYYGMEAEDGDGIARSAAYYEKAAVLAPDDPRIKSLLIRTKAFQGDYDTATELADELVSDFPKSADLAFDAGNVLIAAGQYTRGAELLERAALYFPKRPPYSYAIQGIAYHIVGRSEEGRDLLREATLRSPQFLGNHIMLTIIYDELGDRESAAAQAKHILRINPEFRAQSIVRVLPLKDKLILDTYISALRRAGVP